MRYYVNQNCIGCGLCVATSPSVFEMTLENVAQASNEEVAEDYLSDAKEAMANCPVGAIEEVKE